MRDIHEILEIRIVDKVFIFEDQVTENPRGNPNLVRSPESGMPCVCDADFHATSHHRDRACTDGQGDVQECRRLARQAECKGMEEEHQTMRESVGFHQGVEQQHQIQLSAPRPEVLLSTQACTAHQASILMAFGQRCR